MFYLCETYGKLPSDDFIVNMDPFTKLWLFYGWVEKNKNNSEVLKDQAILIGSFANPEAAQKMLGIGVTKVESSDQDFDTAFEYVKSHPLPPESNGINTSGNKSKLSLGKRKKRLRRARV